MTAPGFAGGFQVDVDGTSQAITELEEAPRELHSIRAQARDLENIVSPTADSVSRDAAIVLSNIALPGKGGSFGTALDDGIQHLQGIVDDLKTSLPRYQAVDRASALPADS